MKLIRPRFTVWRMMIAIAVTAIVIYVLLPLSAADRRMMATYEWLANTEPKVGLTKAEVIRRIGPPSSQNIPANPNEAVLYTWTAEFGSSLEYHEFTLNLQVGKNDQVLAWGLVKHECQGLEALLIRVLRFSSSPGTPPPRQAAEPRRPR